MEVCKFVRKVTSAPFFAIIAWKLGIFEIRAWYRDDASPIDPIDIYSELGGNSSVKIPFTNPTEREVVVDVIVKERLLSRSGESFIVSFVICNNYISQIYNKYLIYNKYAYVCKRQ